MLGAAPHVATQTCPSCGHGNRAAKFCDQCGARLPVRVTCGACGHDNVDAKFCERCGKPLTGAAAINPYAAPGSEPEAHADAPVDASRGARLGASIIDGVCVSLVNVPLLLGGGMIPFSHPSPGPVELIPVVVIGFVVFAVVHGWFLVRGQTIGKLALGLRIVDVETGEPPPLSHTLGLRYLPMSALAIFGPLGSLLTLLDILLIFGAERRCLHDRIAGTRVVRADARHSTVRS